MRKLDLSYWDIQPTCCRMTNIITLIWFALWMSDRLCAERAIVEKRHSVLPGDQREKFSARGLTDLVVEFNACQGNRPYIVLYLCATSDLKLKVTLGSESTILWNCVSDDTRYCTKIAEHLPVQIGCNSNAAVWLSWRISDQIQFRYGSEVGKGLYFDASVGITNCSGVTEWDWGTETGEDTVQMTLYRSEGENRCYLTGSERVGRVACGDSYTDEAWCLSCGCCFDRSATDQPPCFYPQVNQQRRKNCERTFEEVLGAVEFRSIKTPHSNITTHESASFLVLLKHTIKSANIQINFGDGTRPADGVQLDRTTPISDCSSGCKYADWFRAIVTHSYTDAGVFEAVLLITDSSRGVVPFVLRKTVVTVSRRAETVSSLVGETDEETKLHLPSFNPLLHKEIVCNRVETRILHNYCPENDSAKGERWNATLSIETPVPEGQNETLAFSEVSDSQIFDGCSDSPAFANWNGTLEFESETNITFKAVIENDCIPSVHSYAISWELHRLTNDDSDDLSHLPASNGTLFNIPSHSLNTATYKVQLEVRILDVFGIPVNITTATASFNVLPSSEAAISKYYFLNGTVNLMNNLSGPGFSYEWFCTRNELLNISEIEASIYDGHPFGECMKETVLTKTLVSSASKQLFPAAFLRFSSLPASYYFHSITRSSSSSSSKGRTSDIVSTAISVVVLQPGHPPLVRIKCITGCSRPHSMSHPIWLEGACVNCQRKTEELHYAWTFSYAQKSNAHLRSFNWATDSSTGSNRSYVVVFPDKFIQSLAEDEFSFTLTVNRPDLTSSRASFRFQKETSEYETGRNLSVQGQRSTGTSSSSCRHLWNGFLVIFVNLLCFSCSLERPLYNTCLTIIRS